MMMKLYDLLRLILNPIVNRLCHDPLEDEYYTDKMRRNLKTNAKWWVIGFGIGGGLLAGGAAWLLLHLGFFL